MKRTGANLLVESLKNEGVEVIFGYPGGAILPVYDELYRQEEIRHVLTVHEQGAAHADLHSREKRGGHMPERRDGEILSHERG